jgi:hypothetical protein
LVSCQAQDHNEGDQEELSVVDDIRSHPEHDFVQTTDELQKFRSTDAFLDVEHDEHCCDEGHSEPCVESNVESKIVSSAELTDLKNLKAMRKAKQRMKDFSLTRDCVV